MDEIQIVRIAKKLAIPNFIGCYPIDRLLVIKKYPSCYILNYDDHDEKGWNSTVVISFSEKHGVFWQSKAWPPWTFKKMEKNHVLQ